MTTLGAIIEKEQSRLFDEYHVFFAFDDAQAKIGMMKYGYKETDMNMFTDIGAGTILPKENFKKFIEAHGALVRTGIRIDKQLHGLTAIIERELYNHECFYTGDCEPAFKALRGYDVTLQRVTNVFYRIIKINPDVLG